MAIDPWLGAKDTTCVILTMNQRVRIQDASAMNVATRCLPQIRGKQKAGALAH